ncbi:Transcription elongation factor GreA [Paenibacillus plantiphilus]|uniref:Transcription elongation factor GreA n=1 Tax=Paenibacillus plantiphilus TaxID=2905650 RepID=A0ABM9BXD1_9BACL|nr:transcription elongation factor GreA [Paenibacillus plantiphilus]CAH1195741.1 Transcription elongation factor GreA [Paenibacillus plantiphilus]
MSQNEIILTREGLAKLEAELEDLKIVKRREIADRIKLALSYGDLKENSEYHSAKNDQAFMETRILIVEKMLRKAKVAETDDIDMSKVFVGSVVKLHDLEFAETIEYMLVGPSEADVFDNKISYESPLGSSLVGKSVGDIISVAAPDGVIKYELLEIKAQP